MNWNRRAKIKWCKLGDETNFFHTMATYIFRRKEEYFRDEGKIRIATSFFTDLFAERRQWIPNLNLQMLYDNFPNRLLNLADPFTWDEIQRAIKRAPENKSTGPECFTNEFYKLYIQELKPEIIELFNNLHTGSLDPSGVNLAYITLILKLQTPQEVKDYRPVSLQHSIPKLLAKV
jgi:hypothetical protein